MQTHVEHKHIQVEVPLELESFEVMELSQGVFKNLKISTEEFVLRVAAGTVQDLICLMLAGHDPAWTEPVGYEQIAAARREYSEFATSFEKEVQKILQGRDWNKPKDEQTYYALNWLSWLLDWKKGSVMMVIEKDLISLRSSLEKGERILYPQLMDDPYARGCDDPIPGVNNEKTDSDEEVVIFFTPRQIARTIGGMAMVEVARVVDAVPRA